jgi:hypothetical protein
LTWSVIVILAGAENFSPGLLAAADVLAIGFKCNGTDGNGPPMPGPDCGRCLGNAMTGGVFPNVYRATRRRDVGVSFSSELPTEQADVPGRLTAASVPAAGDRSR